MATKQKSAKAEKKVPARAAARADVKAEQSPTLEPAKGKLGVMIPGMGAVARA